MDMENESENSQNQSEMGILDHLEELRGTLFKAIAGIVIGTILSMFFSETLLQSFLQRGGGEIRFVAITPTEGFFTQLKIGILCGIFFSLPWSFYQFWSFISPALHKHEKRFFLFSLPFLVGLFLLGAVISWFFAIPLGLKFLLTFQIAQVETAISIEKYISFCITLILVLGTVFELPVFIIILNYVGILPISILEKYRSHMIVIFFVAAAILTPPDIVTQILVAVPMVILYEISLIVIRFLHPPSEEHENS